MEVFSNPELARNARAQLRMGRMLAAAAICAVLSLIVGYSFAHSREQTEVWGMQFLQTVLGAQVAVLLIGGGIACLHAIHREKEMNTFDFQRVTRLEPLELAVGKLLGAPVMAYFVVLCLVPAALVGAVVGRARPSFFLACYVVLVLGSFAAHAFALGVSLVLERGAASGAVLLFLFLVGIASSPGFGLLRLGELTPFYVSRLVKESEWHLFGPGPTDVFFDQPVHHFLSLVVIYLTFTAWFLLALERNIKRDPAVYEIYSPAQSLGLALYVNFLLVGYFDWSRFPQPLEAQSAIFVFNAMLFVALGFVLLRNRDRLRRLLREAAGRVETWTTALWPAPYLLAGMLLVGFGVIALAAWQRNPKAEWDLGLAVFRLALFSMWIVRDVLYLQWMKLRRTRRPLAMAVLYLIVFYTAVGILFGALDFYGRPERRPIAAAFAPPTALGVNRPAEFVRPELWYLALALQVAASAFFVYLQRKKVLELSAAPAAAVAPAAAD